MSTYRVLRSSGLDPRSHRTKAAAQKLFARLGPSALGIVEEGKAVPRPLDSEAVGDFLALDDDSRGVK